MAYPKMLALRIERLEDSLEELVADLNDPGTCSGDLLEDAKDITDQINMLKDVLDTIHR